MTILFAASLATFAAKLTATVPVTETVTGPPPVVASVLVTANAYWSCVVIELFFFVVAFFVELVFEVVVLGFVVVTCFVVASQYLIEEIVTQEVVSAAMEKDGRRKSETNVKRTTRFIIAIS